MPTLKRTAPFPVLIAFLFKDVEQKLQALHLTPHFRLDSDGVGGFVLTRCRLTLPNDFFGPAVSSITALVGKNSSGKSTALGDIARMLSGNRPIASGCSLIVQCAGRFWHLRHQLDNRIVFEGEDIPDAPDGGFPFDEKQLKIVYFSSSFDPMQRKQALLHSHTPACFVDISSQFVYNHPGRPNHDFKEKLAYLQAIQAQGRPPLELMAECERERTISFEATFSQSYPNTGGSFVALLARYLDYLSPTFRALREALRIELDLSEEAINAELAKIRQGNSSAKNIFWNSGVDYFDFLKRFLAARHPQHAVARNPVVLLLVAGRLNAMDEEAHQANRRTLLLKDILRLLEDPDAVIDSLLGKDFIRHAETFSEHSADRLEHARIVVTIDSKLSPASQTLLDSFISLRDQGVSFSVDFNGLSDGQRSLLTFAARYAAQEKLEPWPGNTLLLIDEHEQGLHPEWQRQFIKHLCALVVSHTHSGGRTQIILSSHSPFVVSDLPETCVNVVGGAFLTEERTFGGNLLELLLSPLFMDRTTGEFAAEKIKGWLDRIKRSRDPDKLKAFEPLIEMVGDTLLRNYLHLVLNQRLAQLDQKVGKIRRD